MTKMCPRPRASAPHAQGAAARAALPLCGAENGASVVRGCQEELRNETGPSGERSGERRWRAAFTLTAHGLADALADWHTPGTPAIGGIQPSAKFFFRSALALVACRHLQFLHGIIGFDDDEEEEEFGCVLTIWTRDSPHGHCRRWLP